MIWVYTGGEMIHNIVLVINEKYLKNIPTLHEL